MNYNYLKFEKIIINTIILHILHYKPIVNLVPNSMIYYCKFTIAFNIMKQYLYLW